MNQLKYLDKIYTFTNSTNELIRMEAQTAVVYIAGFKGLRFLDEVTYPISDWQQLKLLELLRSLPFELLPNLKAWLNSRNSTVVVLALKLVEEYMQYQMHGEVNTCMYHQDEAVRKQAVKTLLSIVDATELEYADEVDFEKVTTSTTNPSELEIGDEDFLVNKRFQLESANYILKIVAAKELVEHGRLGVALLKQWSLEVPIPYAEIYKQVYKEYKK